MFSYHPLFLDACWCCLHQADWGCGSKNLMCLEKSTIAWAGCSKNWAWKGTMIWQKMGSPLYTTINHRSGEGGENETYIKQKIGTKVHRGPLNLKWKWKSVDHHGGQIKTVHDGQWTVVTIMQGVWVGWLYCQLPKKIGGTAKSTELCEARKKRFKNKQKNDEWS